MPRARSQAARKLKLMANEASRRLDDLCRLPVGWDGYGGQPVNPQIAEFALHLLENSLPAIHSPVQFVPGAGGDLQMEWHTVSADLELHLTAPGVAAGFYRNILAGIEGDERNFAGDFSAAASWLRQMGESSGSANMAAA